MKINAAKFSEAEKIFYNECLLKNGDIMNEGYWINYDTEKIIKIDEHEQWIRRGNNAKQLGLSAKLVASFSKFKPVKDRDKFLLFLMKNAPIMRVRGHGVYVSFEYFSHSKAGPISAIYKWCQEEGAGERTGLFINNFATGEQTSIYYDEFKEKMDEGGYEAVMRVAKITKISVHKALADELNELAEKLFNK